MLEIDEKIPYYICNQSKECCTSETCGGEYCKHTTLPIYAAHPENVELLNKFFDVFDVSVDDYGRLNCIEKEIKDGVSGV